jgi:predicted CXXCH cytochrome family protein
MFPQKKIPFVLLVCWSISMLCWTVSSSMSSPAMGGPSARVTTSPAIAKHQKIGKKDCKECHGGLVKHKNLHPVGEECSNCHEYSETKDTGEVKFVSEGPALCLTCHADKQEDLAKKKFKHVAAETDCNTCHDAHSSDEPALLKDKVNQLCFNCHSDKEEEITKKAFPHAPIKDVGCIACHNPHTSNFASLVKVQGNDLCLSCHKMAGGNKKDEAGLVILSQRSMPGGYGKGHPYLGHPVGGVPDPSEANKSMSCSSCHNPHAGKTRQMFKGDVNKGQLCDRCHKSR